MHYLRKISLLAIGVIFAISLSSCNNDKKNNLTIACSENAEPFAYRDASGDLTGFEIELLQAIAADQGFTFKLVPTEFEEIIRQFNRKFPKFDGAISLITWTTERWDGMEFTHPYFRSAMAAAVKKGVTGINSIEDFKGKKVACKSGTTIHEYAEFMKNEIGFTVVPFTKVDDAFAAVVSGSADIVFEEYPLIHYRISKGADIDLAFKGPTQFTFNLAVNKTENYNLIRMFNDGLLNIENNGTYKSIMDKYFPNYPDTI